MAGEAITSTMIEKIHSPWYMGAPSTAGFGCNTMEATGMISFDIIEFAVTNTTHS